jgi:hypothetical protein
MIDHSITIRCPKCGQKAFYDKPFTFLAKKKGIPETNGRQLHIWGGYYVIEKYPSIFAWHPPRRGEGYQHGQGVVRCTPCYIVCIHTLDWPQDAFYRWTIRGHILWAWSEDHARVLLTYLGGTERNLARFPEYSYHLRRLPKVFLTANVRQRIAKQIQAILES